MRILIAFILTLSFAHAGDENQTQELLNVFSKNIKQKGILILTPTDESNNEVATVYGDAKIVVEKDSFRVEVNFKKQAKRILFSYDATGGYKESWFDGKKTEPFQSSKVSEFYSQLLLKNPEALELLFEIKREAIMKDDSKLESYRYQLLPRGNELPKVTLLVSPKFDKIFMFSLAHQGQSFIWTDNDYADR